MSNMSKLFQLTLSVTMGIILASFSSIVAGAGSQTAGLPQLEATFVNAGVAITASVALTSTISTTLTVHPATEIGPLEGEDTVAGPLPGDVNNDGRLNVQDLAYLSRFLGITNSVADLNNDALVDILDLQLLTKLIDQIQPLPTDPLQENFADDNENVKPPDTDLWGMPDPDDTDDLDFLEFFSDDSIDQTIPDPVLPDTPADTETDFDLWFDSPDGLGATPDSEQPDPGSFDSFFGDDETDPDTMLDGDQPETDPFDIFFDDTASEPDDDAFVNAFEESVGDESDWDEAVIMAIISPQPTPHKEDYPQKNDKTDYVKNELPEREVIFTETITAEIANTPTPHITSVPAQSISTATPQSPPTQPNITCSDDAVFNHSVDICTLVSIGISYGGYSTLADINADGLINKLDLDIVANRYRHLSFAKSHNP